MNDVILTIEGIVKCMNKLWNYLNGVEIAIQLYHYGMTYMYIYTAEVMRKLEVTCMKCFIFCFGSNNYCSVWKLGTIGFAHIFMRNIHILSFS